MKVHPRMRSGIFAILLPLLLLQLFDQASYADPDIVPPAETTRQAASSDDNLSIRSWFRQYDRIRKEAQMTFPEKLQAAHLLNRGLSRLKSEYEVSYARTFISTMVDRYERAEKDLVGLAEVAQTHELQQGYERYFHDARAFFSDYISFQEQQAQEGNAAHQNLVDEKEKLASLDRDNKELDAILRHQYHIARFGHILGD